MKLYIYPFYIKNSCFGDCIKPQLHSLFISIFFSDLVIRTIIIIQPYWAAKAYLKKSH